jgi:5-methyltetrahydropteroyltriglutamate--homocysteine methyltransferase
MQRSVAKILTTHVGSLPFLSLDKGVAVGDQSHLADDIAAIVTRQRDIGIDIVNEGEYAKGGDWLPALWDRIGMDMGLAAFRARCALRIEALNHALRNIPEDRVRYHLCWGSWHGPHAYDLELERIVDLVLKVKAQAFLIEGANARHEHEVAVWDKVKLPDGKILIPGVITHSTDVIEHPELVSRRLQRYARCIGKENLIAGADCGFGGRSHPQIAWAKLRAMIEGAALASKALGFAAA